jgi:hypothetical protein
VRDPHPLEADDRPIGQKSTEIDVETIVRDEDDRIRQRPLLAREPRVEVVGDRRRAADGDARAEGGVELRAHDPVRAHDDAVAEYGRVDASHRRDGFRPSEQLASDVIAGGPSDGREHPSVCGGGHREGGRDRCSAEPRGERRGVAESVVEREGEERGGKPVRLGDRAPEREREEERAGDSEGPEEERLLRRVGAAAEEIARERDSEEREDRGDVEELAAGGRPEVP